jgi:hypothetical protein
MKPLGSTPMGEHDDGSLEAAGRQAAAHTGTKALTIVPAGPGSRRRRLWEFGSHALCPVIGACLSIAALRRLVEKALGGKTVAGDYDLHCGVITECRQRTAIAEALQRELDRRFKLALRDASKLKAADALAAWWIQALQAQDIAGPFWAVMTHAQCTPGLEERVIGDVHMLQHQAGMAARIDLHRFEAVADENAALKGELAAAKERAAHNTDAQARRIDAQQAEIVRLRAQLIVRDSLNAQLREDFAALEAAAPDLKARHALAEEARRLTERVQSLERELRRARYDTDRQRERIPIVAESSGSAAGAEPAANDPPQLDDRAVLCVGGRTSAVPLYRRLIERCGARFMHHDGEEDGGSSRLDASLAAADLVICQAGCVSHQAYWRVKDHCKRTGKRCVFVQTPSSAGLRRALRLLGPSTIEKENTS